MRSRIHTAVLPFETGDFGQEIHQIFSELSRASLAEGLSGECAPPIDVFESDEALEVVVDLPGVDSTSVRVLAKGDQLLVAGEKRPRRTRAGDSTFHLVERGFGRFARTIRLARACNAGQAEATLVEGVLRVRVPKIAEHRGRAIQIAVHPVRDVERA